MSSSPEPASNEEKDVSSKKRKSVPEIAVDLSLPEPPSKKAKRALKKGKPLPSSSTNADSGNKSSAGNESDADVDGNPTDGKPESEKRSEHGVWVGNLAFETTRESLTTFLVTRSGGSISESNITRLKLPTNKSSTKGQGMHPSRVGKVGNKGFAYVDFDTELAMYTAIGLSESELGGRKLLIKHARNFEGRPAVAKPDPTAEGQDVAADGKTTAGKKQVDGTAAAGTGSKKIFVGNLPYQVTSEYLQAHFEKCGEINWVKVATFEDSGKCKGYGWVNFREEESAGSAVRGFVKVPEEEELELEDFEDKDEEDSDEHAEEKKAQKKIKMRKWWVNRIMGRDLKIEIAEDDQTRYSKRFKKGGNRGRGDHPVGRGGSRRNDGERDAGPRPKKKDGFAEEKVYAENGDGYRTGGIVESKGKKITFDG